MLLIFVNKHAKKPVTCKRVSLVCSGIATEDETCSPDLLMVGTDLFVPPEMSVIDCVKELG